MPRVYVPEEVEVLRFFEEAPIEKAELLFNIVKDKMGGRLAGDTRSGESSLKKKRQSVPKEVRADRPKDEAGVPTTQN